MIFRYLLLIAAFQMPVGVLAQVKLMPQAVEVKFDDCPCSSQEEHTLFSSYFIADYSIDYIFNHHGCYERGELVCARAYYTDESGKRNLVGLAIFRKEDQGLYIEYLCVDKNYTHCGVGKKIIASLVNRYRPQCIRLFSLLSAVGFYKKIGFVSDPIDSSSKNMIKRAYPQIENQFQQSNNSLVLHSA